MRNADLTDTQRAVLGMVARGELFRASDGWTYKWVQNASSIFECPRLEGSELDELEAGGLIAHREPAGESWWEPTDKAYEE